jgi:hypothetical protein
MSATPDLLTQIAKAATTMAVSAVADAILDAAAGPLMKTEHDRDAARIAIVFSPTVVQFATGVFAGALQKAEAAIAALEQAKA